MHSVCCCSLPVWRRSSLKKGTPSDLFWPRPGSAPGRIWPKNNNTCKGPWVLHPYQVSSKSIKRFWKRSRKCEKFTPDGRRRTTDGRTDERRTVRYDNSSLEPWLRWAKNPFKMTYVTNLRLILTKKFARVRMVTLEIRLYGVWIDSNLDWYL